MSSVTPGVDQLLASIETASLPPPRPANIGDPSPELMARLRATIRRAQNVDDSYCFIEETPWHTFVLHGLQCPSRAVMVPDPHMDGDLSDRREPGERLPPMPDRPEFRFVLEPMGERQHLIVGMTSPVQADEFSRVRWKTVRDDAHRSLAVEGLDTGKEQ